MGTHCENYARNEPTGIEILTLDVIKGNKAITLYQRFGFEIIPPESALESVIRNFFVLLLVGRPYGWCNSGWGSHDDEKVTILEALIILCITLIFERLVI